MAKTEKEPAGLREKTEEQNREPDELTEDEMRKVEGGMVISSTAVPKSQVIKAHS